MLPNTEKPRRYVISKVDSFQGNDLLSAPNKPYKEPLQDNWVCLNKKHALKIPA